MRWQGRQGSQNVDDRRRRGRNVRRAAGGTVGLGAIIYLLFAVLTGGDTEQAMQQIQNQAQQAPQQTQTQQGARPDDELAKFVSVVLKDTEDIWDKLFREQLGKTYRKPTLVLFSGEDRSACGFASAATGPFYCPADQSVYIDLSFYQTLKDRFKAPGDFAMAYIVAHEVGHHVQNLLGITTEVSRQQQRMRKEDANALSVRLELQADFLAGVWAHHDHKLNNILQEGDVEEAMNAAAAVGDDKIQMESRGYVVPESFTHGTSEQRMEWFYKGLKSGDLRQGDTFGVQL